MGPFLTGPQLAPCCRFPASASRWCGCSERSEPFAAIRSIVSPMGGFALTRHLPGLEVLYVSLGEYPTPIEHLPALGDVWLKREDLSSPIYGGNKIRTLENPVRRRARAGASSESGPSVPTAATRPWRAFFMRGESGEPGAVCFRNVRPPPARTTCARCRVRASKSFAAL